MAGRPVETIEEYAWAERLGASIGTVRSIGTRQLSLCRSDAARRILLKAVGYRRPTPKQAKEGTIRKPPKAEKLINVQRMMDLAGRS